MESAPKENLISIEELIKRARSLGVDFGKGDPKNRLRYYAKIGIFPHALRKKINGKPSQGVYPEGALDILLEIDKQLKQGKSVQAIKKEQALKREKELKLQEEKLGSLSQKEPLKSVQEPIKEDIQGNIFEAATEQIIEETETTLKEEAPSFFSEEIFTFQRRAFLFQKIISIFLIIFSISSIGLIGVGFAKYGVHKSPSEFIQGFIGGIFVRKIKISETPIQGKAPSITQPEIFELPSAEPYLTINAETEINAPLKVKQTVSAEEFLVTGKNYRGKITFQNLTADRTYILPDQSGTICLSTGNCIGIGGEVSSSGGTANRLAKFSSARKIINSSIVDNFSKGIALTIDSSGNIGIGTETPQAKLDIKGKLKVSGEIVSPNIYVSAENGGNVGIGTQSPNHTLDVKGEIYATGDICTTKGGKKCLSQMSTSSQIPFIVSSSSGVSGSGTSGTMAMWSDSSTLTSSVIYQSSNNVGIGVSNPTTKLDVDGIVKMTGFQMPTGAQSGYVLTSDDSGVGTWQELPSISLPSGTVGQTLRHDGSNWVADSLLYNTGTEIGIGTDTPQSILDVAGTVRMTGFQMPTNAQAGYILTSDASGVGTWQPAPSGTLPSGTTAGQTLRWDGSSWVVSSFLFNDDGTAVGINTVSPSATLTVNGTGLFSDILTVETTNIPQLTLKYDNNNTLTFSINDSQTEIAASKTLVIDSLTGTIQAGSNVTSIDASGATIQAATYLSGANDSTVRKSGELVFRQAIPIFRYAVPAQTTSASFVRVSKYFDSAIDTLPPVLPGATRKYSFLINYADDIPTTDNSSWRVFRPNENTTATTFTLSGQNMPSLDEGKPKSSGLIDLPSDDWQLEVEIPSGYQIRIFNIFLLVYDQIN